MGKAKINAYFKEIQAKKKNLFIPYIVAGDGGLDILNDRIQFLEDAGVAAVELGIPFSDPVADGPTIQEAGLRALNQGVTLQKILETIASKKEARRVPIILMTYINPIFALGLDKFTQLCQEAGVDGVIIPDIPMEEEDLVSGPLTQADVAFIRLAALTSTPERLARIAKKSEGFLYAVAVAGTTGARTSHEVRVNDYLENLKRYSQVPVLAGFGVSNPDQAHALSVHCDGVIVGSRIVDLFHEKKVDEIQKLIQDSIAQRTIKTS